MLYLPRRELFYNFWSFFYISLPFMGPSSKKVPVVVFEVAKVHLNIRNDVIFYVFNADNESDNKKV